MRKNFLPKSILNFCLLLFVCSASAQNSRTRSYDEMARSIFAELIGINTTHSTGNTTIAANAIADRLKKAGFDAKDVLVVGPEERNKNLVARIHGSGKRKPVLFLAHLDVVEAKREDWTMDPFVLTEKDGFFYGRGSLDIKSGVAILVTNFIRLKQEGYLPDRDLIIALTAGEESGKEYDGAEWLVNTQRSLIDAEFCINMDAGEPQRRNGRRLVRPIQVSEKGIFYMELEVKNPGGHSSQPAKDNAIYRLANGLVHLGAYDFPVQFSETTKSYFTTMANFENGKLAEDMKSAGTGNPDSAVVNRLAKLPYYNAIMRTTCVATMVEAGHAINALPQSAKATINCRLLPGTSEESVVHKIRELLADTGISIKVTIPLIDGGNSPLTPEIKQTVDNVTEKLWPGITVMPILGVGASDGKYLRSAGLRTYGVSGVFLDVDDFRMHGRDERIRTTDLYDGLEYQYELIRAFSSGTN